MEIANDWAASAPLDVIKLSRHELFEPEAVLDIFKRLRH
jgi:hypothetical protein